MYKLFERLILNHLAPFVEQHLIPKQAGFRPGKSCTSQLLNLAQLIEDGWDRQKNGLPQGRKYTHNPKPVYLGATLGRTLSYKHHVIKTKPQAGARNNILRKLSNSKWGTDLGIIQSTTFALCYSAGQYARRSTHAKKMDPVLNMACRASICYVVLLHYRSEGHPSHK